jgi:hypothetical protein
VPGGGGEQGVGELLGDVAVGDVQENRVNAVVPSLLTSPEAALAKGSGAEATWGALDSAL